ncbi:Arabinanase/levansucrase/invertase [Saitoella complicata NRRL Y-17804]|uniref:beta-fructofuranosidase n=1 Tax=Saitoella complicata (strain BCRC 22490 / CBS 7301 / JCM 7358 / NBRC 10748 / NRRL Y-17804) TaxID=698492 RepID=A0A0E9N9Z1_SAICN|nr:Arabinanase/levansucrase/invertase [Saitoella complicata NRRL Y-17804]ODQ55793.1 Arabinanase/levansucrase/invertase [Saitoella complicata NRRL Y-17804]GAO46707.1 hypothetical protein G7K_0930-t1 [Saitoella complicata NRRL Y-17804]
MQHLTTASYHRPSKTQAAADAIPVVYNGEYHVFHLATPPNTIHHPPRLRSTWSHMRSKDLVSWTRDPEPALTPGDSKDALDTDGTWTGSAVEGPDELLHIFYTGYNLSHGGRQVIIEAVATDKACTSFIPSTEPIKVVNNGVSTFEDIDFRDAYVFYNDLESCYWMLVATRLRSGPYWTRGCIALLTSPDLSSWTVEEIPLFSPNDMFCPECPELFELSGKWYLVYSRFAAPDAGTVYRVADSPRGPFRKISGVDCKFDGRRWYAAKSCPKIGEEDKRVFFGWIGDKCHEDGKWLWGGHMALPREVSAAPNGALVIKPCLEALTAAFPTEGQKTVEGAGILESFGATKTKFLDDAFPTSYVLRVTLTSTNAPSFGLLFRTNLDLAGYALKFKRVGHTFSVILAQTPAPLDDFWADQYRLYLPRNVDGPELVRHDGLVLEEGRVEVQVLVVGETVEFFVDGKVVLSYRVQVEERAADGTTIGLIPDEDSGMDSDGDVAARQNVDEQADTERSGVKEFGLFLEDGTLCYSDFVVMPAKA